MLDKSIRISLLAVIGALILPGSAQADVIGALILPGSAQAEALPTPQTNLSGGYRCEPEPSPCPWLGQTMPIVRASPMPEFTKEQGSFVDPRLKTDWPITGGLPWTMWTMTPPDRSI